MSAQEKAVLMLSAARAAAEALQPVTEGSGAQVTMHPETPVLRALSELLGTPVELLGAIHPEDGSQTGCVDLRIGRVRVAFLGRVVVMVRLAEAGHG